MAATPPTPPSPPRGSGASAGYIGGVGADAAGRSLRALWQREGVATDCVWTDDAAPTGLYLVTHDAEGHHFDFYRANSAAARMGPAQVPEAAIRAARVLHVSGISQAISSSACDAVFHAIEVARAAGVTVSYDTNLRRALWPVARAAAVIHAALGRADIAFPSLDDAQALTGLTEAEAIADFYLRLTPLVLLKLGPRGGAGGDARDALPGAGHPGRAGGRHRRRGLLRRRLPGEAPGRRRDRGGGALCQCRRGALHPGLWRGGADSPRGGGAGAVGAGLTPRAGDARVQEYPWFAPRAYGLL